MNTFRKLSVDIVRYGGFLDAFVESIYFSKEFYETSLKENSEL